MKITQIDKAELEKVAIVGDCRTADFDFGRRVWLLSKYAAETGILYEWDSSEAEPFCEHQTGE
jgi:hypothetical protein